MVIPGLENNDVECFPDFCLRMVPRRALQHVETPRSDRFKTPATTQFSDLSIRVSPLAA